MTSRIRAPNNPKPLNRWAPPGFVTEVLAVIPARGGSKGVPGKNLRELGGKELIRWTIEAAIATTGIDRTLVTTDDETIARVARGAGAEVIDRPAELATDDAPTIDAVLHAIAGLPDESIVILLQPTTPLRTAADIDGALAMFAAGGGDTLVSVCAVEHPPHLSFVIEDGHLEPLFGRPAFDLRRQDLPEAVRPNGAIYISRAGALREHQTFYGARILAFEMPPERSVDIDAELDLIVVSALLANRSQP